MIAPSGFGPRVGPAGTRPRRNDKGSMPFVMCSEANIAPYRQIWYACRFLFPVPALAIPLF